MTPENSHLIAFCYEDFYQNGFNLSSLCYYQFSQIFKQSLRFSIIYFFNEIFLFNMQQKYKATAQGGLKKSVPNIFQTFLKAMAIVWKISEVSERGEHLTGLSQYALCETRQIFPTPSLLSVSG